MLIRKRYKDNQFTFPCPVCSIKVDDVHYIYHQSNNEYKIYKCRSCGFMFARPIFIPKLEDRQMDSIGDAEFFNNPFLKSLYEKLILQKEISYVRKIIGEGTFSLLDIGCGTGCKTSFWSNCGFEVTGLEPSKVRSKAAKDKYGLRIISNYIENIDVSEKFNVVILRHIIEHIEDPLGMLIKAHSLFHKNGVVVIVVPNINCIGRYIFGTKWTWGIPYHCNFFNPKALKRLIRRAGFEVLKIYQTPSPILYPGSFLRLFPDSEDFTAKIYHRLSFLSLLPFIPLVILGYLLRLSDNITIIARVKYI